MMYTICTGLCKDEKDSEKLSKNQIIILKEFVTNNSYNCR